MRRLPVYFVIDVSESMVGEKQQHVERGINTIMQELQGNPYALETVYISVIIFAGKSQLLVPLTDICSFSMPSLPIGSGTSLSEGLKLLMHELDSSVVKTTTERKGDWKPIVFLFTDGIPTDDPTSAIQNWHKKYANSTTFVAVSIGEYADLSVLRKLTDSVLRMKETDDISFKSFFAWVTASIQASSTSIAMYGNEQERLPPASSINLEKVTPSSNYKESDDDLILLGQCEHTKKYYLIRFKKVEEQDGCFVIEKVYKIDKDLYINLSNSDGVVRNINSSKLFSDNRYQHYCPYCENQNLIVFCGRCGKISCSDGHSTVCPWCGNSGVVGAGGGMDVARTQG